MYGSVRGSVADGKWTKMVYTGACTGALERVQDRVRERARERGSVYGRALLQHSKVNGRVMEVNIR